MMVGLSPYPHSSLEFIREDGIAGKGQGKGRATLEFQEKYTKDDEDASEKLARVDERVARAWGFDLAKLETEVVDEKSVSKVIVARIFA
jgi:hypothetical protein